MVSTEAKCVSRLAAARQAHVMGQVPDVMDSLIEGKCVEISKPNPSNEKVEGRPDVVWLIEGCQISRFWLTR